jgi:L-alanine-DL-glutamate epimerase-like enolase superfamily enzyme
MPVLHPVHYMMHRMASAVIEAIDSCVLRVPRRQPVRSSYAQYDALEVVVVQLRTSDGLEGLGYAKVIGTGGASIRSFLDSEYAPLVRGREPLEVRALWGEMFQHSQTRGRKGVAMYALSAMDIALWDLAAQAAGLPLHRMLGAVRDEVPVYGNGCWLSLTIDELLEEANRYVELGCFGVKVKIGTPDLRADAQRVAAVRDAIGDDVQVMVDANQRYDVLTALRMARLLEPYDITWFEEPVTADSIRLQARLARSSPIPIAAGENEYTRFGFRDLIESEAVHILQPDVHRVGGVTEFLKVAHLAEAYNLPVSSHLFAEMSLQVLGGLPNANYLEYMPWFEPLYADKIEFRNGAAVVPDRPGWGISFDSDAVARMSI